MSRLNTFYLAPALWREPFVLEGEEAHHLLAVLRARPGQKLRLIDGCGIWGIFTLDTVHKKKAILTLETQHNTPPKSFPLTLALAWSKNLRRSYVLEKAVELGASSLWFWPARRSQGTAPQDIQNVCQRSFIAAAKQCETTWMPQVQVMPTLAALLEASHGQGTKLVCWEEASPDSLIHDQALTHNQGSIVVIGPEGGLEKQETLEMQNAGFKVASLGSSILRFETAAVFILSLYHWSVTRQELQN